MSDAEIFAQASADLPPGGLLSCQQGSISALPNVAWEQSRESTAYIAPTFALFKDYFSKEVLSVLKRHFQEDPSVILIVLAKKIYKSPLNSKETKSSSFSLRISVWKGQPGL